MAGTTGYPRLMAAGSSANDAFLDAITAAVDTLDTYVARVNAAATIEASDNTTFKMQGLNGPAVSGSSRTVKLLGRLGSEDQTFLDALNAIATTFAAYRTAVNASAAIVSGDTTCYKVQDVNGAAVSGATVFYRSTSRFDTDLDDLETQINGMVDALSQFASAWNLKQGGTPTTLVVSTVKRLRPFTRPADGVEDTTRNIAVDGGNNQSTAVTTQPTTAFTAVVTDGTGAAVEGEQVTWTTSSNGSITSSSLTNASGIATATPTAGEVAQDETYTATTSTGQSVSFTLTAVAGTAANIAAASTQDQSALTSAAVGAPPSVLVTDAYGNPKSGVTVTFAVTAGGGSRDPATVNSASSTGLATLTSWTLGGSAGLNTLTATASGLTGSPVTFNANAVAAAPTQIAVQSGGSQTGVTAGSAATATVFRVKDVSNNAVAGVTVAFTITSGNGSLSAASAVTDASGDASVTYTTHTTIETATIKGAFTNAAGTEVSASTTIASTFGTKSKLAIQTQPSSNGSSGTALSQQPIILIQDTNGNTVTSATDTITASVQSGNATLTAGSTKAAVAGVATFSGMTLTDTDSGANVLRFSSGALTTVDSGDVTLAPPIPVALQFSGPISDVVEDAGVLTFNVLVVDDTNTVVPGATNAVAVALTTPGGATLSGDTSVNASSGIASFGATESLTIDTAGAYTLTATATGLTSATSPTFNVSAATGSNRPTGMTTWTTGDLTTETLDSQWADASTHQGWKWYTHYAPNKIFARSLAQQASWRNGAVTAFPLPPTGSDRVLSNEITPNGSNIIVAGEKGKGNLNAPTGTKSIYLDMYCLASSNWKGEPRMKRWYFKNSTEGPVILMVYASGAGALSVRVHYQGSPGGPTISAFAWTRNVWARIEIVCVAASTAGGSDGHFTVFKDGTKVHQKTDMTTAQTTWVLQEWLAYFGGGLSTSGTETQYFLTADGWTFATSTSRVAAP